MQNGLFAGLSRCHINMTGKNIRFTYYSLKFFFQNLNFNVIILSFVRQIKV